MHKFVQQRDQKFMWRDQKFMKPTKVSYHLATFGGYRRCGSGDIMILVCHMILLDHVLTRSRNQRVMWVYEQKPIKVSYHPATFLSHRHSGSGDIFLICHVILTLQGYLENTELTALILHIAILLTSGIPIYNSEVPNTTGRKMRRRGRRTQFTQTQ